LIYNSIFYYLRCIYLYLRLSILWFTLHWSLLTSEYFIDYTVSIFSYVSIFHNLHYIIIYLRLNIWWFTLNVFLFTTQYFIIYTDFLQCYSILECEWCDLVFVGNFFKFRHNLIISVTLNLHRKTLLDWTNGFCYSSLFFYWFCLNLFHHPKLYWNIFCWFGRIVLLLIKLDGLLRFLWINFLSILTFHLILLHYWLITFILVFF